MQLALGGKMKFTKEDTKVIKGIAIVLMMYHHLFAFPDRISEQISYFSTFSLNGNTIAYWIGEFGKLCVAIFMFLAGYGTYISCLKKDVTICVKNKLVNIYTIYWKVFLIFIPICMLAKVESVEKNIVAFLWNFSGMDISYNGEWWFITPYIIILCLYPILKRFFERTKSELFSDLFFIVLTQSLVTYVVPMLLETSWLSKWGTSLLGYNLKIVLELLPVFMMGCVFAKYDLISKIKQRSMNNFLYWILSFIVLACLFYVRRKVGASYDYLYAPIFACASIVALQTLLGKIFYKILLEIGKESTVIWLVHSFYCYMLCQEFVYMPKYSVLIVIWLIFLCCVTSKFIKIIYGGLKRIYDGMNLKVSSFIFK